MASNFVHSTKPKLESCDQSNSSRRSRRSSSQPTGKQRIVASSANSSTTSVASTNLNENATTNSPKITERNQKLSTNNSKSNAAVQKRSVLLNSCCSASSIPPLATTKCLPTTKPVARIRPRNETVDNETHGIQQLRKLIKLRQNIETFQRKKLETLNVDLAFYEKTVQSPKFQLELYQQQQSLALIAYYEKILELQKRIREIYERLEALETAGREETEFQKHVFKFSNLGLFKFDPVLVLTTSAETRV